MKKEWNVFNSWHIKGLIDGRRYLISSRGEVYIATFVEQKDLTGYFDGYPYAEAWMELPQSF